MYNDIDKSIFNSWFTQTWINKSIIIAVFYSSRIYDMYLHFSPWYIIANVFKYFVIADCLWEYFNLYKWTSIIKHIITYNLTYLILTYYTYFDGLIYNYYLFRKIFYFRCKNSENYFSKQMFVLWTWFKT